MALFGAAAGATITMTIATIGSVVFYRKDFIDFNRTIDKADILIHTSILTGKKTSILKGKYFEMKATILTDWSDAAIKTAYLDKLSQFVGEIVTISFSDFLNEDGDAIEIDCIMPKCEPFYYQNISFHDAFKIELISEDYVDFPELIEYETPAE